MMMFSLRPSSSSRAPRIAASVRTRVVSWNDAAEMNDCVVRLALVMPSSSGSDVAGVCFFFLARSFSSRKTCLSTCSPSRNSVSPGLEDAHLLQHLPHDHADVLVVDLHALQAVDLLHFVQQILLHRARALDPQNVVRIHRTFGQTVAGAHAVALVHAQVLAGARPRTAAAPRSSSICAVARSSGARRSRACRA